ncbi:MAG: hypothetical protein FWF79_05905 [Defluviitaleaceae bacterium]|nr:hypothetical protein [Defluviitaleaceae bacterium]
MNVQLLTNAEIRATGIRAGRAEVYDLMSGETYDIFWGGAPRTHTDFSPLTPNDTAIMERISSGWNWIPRPVILTIQGVRLAAGVHHFPHGSIIGGNPRLPNMSNTRPSNGWAVEGWGWAIEALRMDGTRPRDGITRQEVATLLHRFYKPFTQNP